MIIEPFYIDPEGFRLEVKWGQTIRFIEVKADRQAQRTLEKHLRKYQK